ncbi:inactive hydroxysteroid dehydrogenase-like protein 1 isoform X2 [Aricia agestis]|uniref:inactive hydroxysteroid dehydrogenase-like protein 1 isoform X2 n=1 Tax=Aricia agestis TaxID=91739 RepID=UPI001C209482|nr:inactive hydroxysteroid dehydrogenase-like protein 1 isoform X2 [Aricia agestis]
MLLYLCCVIGAVNLAYFFAQIIKILYQIFVLSFKKYYQSHSYLREKYGDWAVVTGSTDGVGKQYALQLAQRGLNVVLISRNPHKLRAVAEEIESKYKVQTKIIAVDFSEGTQVYARIEKELSSIPVVNNVGVLDDHPMRFCDAPLERLWEMVNVNVVTAVSMCRLLLPGMLRRNRGVVVNVSSAAGWQAMPLMGVYSSTKAFVNTFTVALQEECSQSNVDISFLYPSFIASNMTSFSQSISRGDLFTPDAASFAEQAVNAIGSFPMTAGYWLHILQLELFLLLPSWVRTKLSGRALLKLRSEYEETLNNKQQ